MIKCDHCSRLKGRPSVTTISTVSVDSVEGSTHRGRAHIVNPDVPYVPEETVLPLALLTDAWWKLDKGTCATKTKRTESGTPLRGSRARNRCRHAAER